MSLLTGTVEFTVLTPEWNQFNAISRSCYHRDALFVIDVRDWTSIAHFISPLL